MKKAQTEIVGLMMIVVIISLGMLFYLSYSTDELLSGGNVSDSIRKEYIDNELSMSMVQTLVRTTIAECNDQPLDVIIKDCGLEEYRVTCSTPGFDSCLVLTQFLELQVAPLLDEWGKSYYLGVTDTNNKVLARVDAGCSPGQVGRRPPGIQPIPYFPEPGTAFLELAICNT